jgi:hypothetical protein
MGSQTKWTCSPGKGFTSGNPDQRRNDAGMTARHRAMLNIKRDILKKLLPRMKALELAR